MNTPRSTPQPEPGRRAAIVLAVLVHAVLLGLLIYGVAWQTREPEPVSVTLVAEGPNATLESAAPEPAAAAAPAPAPTPAPLPKLSAPKADIAIKDKVSPKRKETPPAPAPKPAKKVVEKPPVKNRYLEEQMKREADLLDARYAEQQLMAKIAAGAAAEEASRRAKSAADYQSRISGKIRGNMLLPPDIQGNPEAQFLIYQLPTGDILDVKLQKSSGQAALDAAIERAILKSSPLPKPDDPALFQRALVIKYQPFEE